MTDCPMSEYAAIDQKALALLQTELLFALLGEEDVNLLLEGFVAQASSLLVGASLHLDLHMPAAPEDERAVNVHVPGQEGHGRLTMSVVEAAPEGARTLLLELARFIERVLLHAFKGSLLSPGQRAVPQSMIARELHDGVAQELAYLSLQTARLQRRIQQPDKALAIVEVLKGGLSRLQRQVRELISEARLTMNGKTLRESLGEAVEELSRRSNMVFHLDNRLPDGLLSGDVELQLLQIVREALVNALRHARARNVWISLVRDNAAGVLMHVEDDGIGLQPASHEVGHFGMSIMQERAALIGAGFEVGARQGGGTRLALVLPADAFSMRSHP